MAEMTPRRRGELLRGVFKVLLSHPDGLQVKSVLKELEKLVPPTEYEASFYPDNPNVQRFGRIVRFTTIVVVKAGWLEKDKGLWSLTDEGRKAYQRHTDPEEFYNEAVKLYRQWKKERPEPPDQTDDEKTADAATAVEEAEESAWGEIEEHLGGMNPYDFQKLVAGLLRGMGYYVGWVAPPGPDRGIDILAHTDPLGIKGPRIKVQVKRRQDQARVQEIRSFMAVLGDEDVGIFVCTGGFSKDAEFETRGQEKRRLMLVDLRKLFDLWAEYYQRIPEEYRRLLPLKTLYFLAPDE